MLLKSVVNQIRQILFAILCELFKPFLPFWPTSDADHGRSGMIGIRLWPRFPAFTPQ
jgi:hypothetical protein